MKVRTEGARHVTLPDVDAVTVEVAGMRLQITERRGCASVTIIEPFGECLSIIPQASNALLITSVDAFGDKTRL
ncbi:MAG: hypothetical protein Q7V31_12180 [Parvibaculum sp.]|uniref:hypothetical protein n=1 Tax=Parvibaculum sp. TaxID=2024848 RepID=UPI002725F9AA|nr:hypothetical protein [Parvibaculum sp.]MDO8839675.1 hypothetical protein [Parvibaculum sp.]